jgi:ferrous iron transport protein A
MQKPERGIAMPLTLAVLGEEVIIKRIGGNADVRAHLQNLGFVSGAVVMVVSSMGGNLIVNVKNARIAISKEMAQKIFI